MYVHLIELFIRLLLYVACVGNRTTETSYSAVLRTRTASLFGRGISESYAIFYRSIWPYAPQVSDVSKCFYARIYSLLRSPRRTEPEHKGQSHEGDTNCCKLCIVTSRLCIVTSPLRFRVIKLISVTSRFRAVIWLDVVRLGLEPT